MIIKGKLVGLAMESYGIKELLWVAMNGEGLVCVCSVVKVACSHFTW